MSLGRAKVIAGALEVTYRESPDGCGRLASKLPFRAIVFGHVILAVTREELQRIGPHERVHVEQYESSLWQLVRGRGPYWHNHFEIQTRNFSK